MEKINQNYLDLLKSKAIASLSQSRTIVDDLVNPYLKYFNWSNDKRFFSEQNGFYIHCWNFFRKNGYNALKNKMEWTKYMAHQGTILHVNQVMKSFKNKK